MAKSDLNPFKEYPREEPPQPEKSEIYLIEDMLIQFIPHFCLNENKGQDIKSFKRQCKKRG